MERRMEEIRHDVPNLLRLAGCRGTGASSSAGQRDGLPCVPGTGHRRLGSYGAHGVEPRPRTRVARHNDDLGRRASHTRPGAVVRIPFAGSYIAQKAAFQLGLAIDRSNAALPPQTSTIWASLERPPSIQMARRALLPANHDIAALGIPKEELRAHHGDQSIHHGKYELVRAHTRNFVRGHDWEVRPITAGWPWTDRPLRMSYWPEQKAPCAQDAHTTPQTTEGTRQATPQRSTHDTAPETTNHEDEDDHRIRDRGQKDEARKARSRRPPSTTRPKIMDEEAVGRHDHE